MSKNNKIKFIGSFDTNKKCFLIDGEGAAVLKINTSASELTEVIKSIAYLRERPIEFTLKGLQKDYKNAGRKKKSKTIR